MEFLIELASRGLAFWNGLDQFQQVLVGAVSALLGYLVLGSIVRSMARLAMLGLILIATFAALLTVMPDTMCAVRWPEPIASMCAH